MRAKVTGTILSCSSTQTCLTIFLKDVISTVPRTTNLRTNLVFCLCGISELLATAKSLISWSDSKSSCKIYLLIHYARSFRVGILLHRVCLFWNTVTSPEPNKVSVNFERALWSRHRRHHMCRQAASRSTSPPLPAATITNQTNNGFKTCQLWTIVNMKSKWNTCESLLRS